ncbi:alpha/beta hydrolase family protein [Paenibacillus senegalensis]|uniref:alpha/beta hydrolase family protein n=1 Tax=Paenibacillus senegalensis TaxID=1465766 RepID=UPI000289C629|nr:alpha/beta fold hydrolase [Paenibacillus senegalensis]
MKRKSAKKLKTFVAGTVLAMGVSVPYHVLAETPVIPISAEAVEIQQVPLRQVAEAIGAQVEWNAESGQATARRGKHYFTVTPGQTTAEVNGESVTMAEAAKWSGSTVTVPIDVIKEAFEANISWSPSTGVLINYNDIVSLTGFILHHAVLGNSVAGSFMSAQLGAVMPPDDLLVMLAQLSQTLGQPDKLISVTTNSNGVHHNVVYTYLTDLEMPMTLTFRYDQNYKLNDFYMPYGVTTNGLYKIPDYDDPSTYTEKEVVLGEGPFQLPGTLTLPNGEGPFPVVVLVHGSGPNDRDEAVGAYATFRDLAVGLAAQDVAVLRYEKRTREYQFQTFYDSEFTVNKESVDDALAAVSYLAQEDKIDPDQIFVVGHSQGGMVMPRIIEKDQSGAIAGAVIISSPYEPLEDIVNWQMEQRLDMMRDMGVPAEQLEVVEQQKAAWDQLYAMLKDESAGVEQLQQAFGAADGYWWADFRNFYAAELAKDQEGPLLIMQGENDIQVHIDQLDGWKEALANRQDVEYLQYPNMNHFLVEVDQPSTGMEYEVPGNVSPQLINDLADWVKKIAARS